MIVNLISYRNIMSVREVQFKKFDYYTKISTLVVTVIAIGFLISFSIDLDKGFLTDLMAYAQSEQQPQNEGNGNSSDQVTIKLDSVKFSTLDGSGNNQLKVDIAYETNDPKLVNTIMAGVMKVYTTDGTLIKTSTIPSGYVLGQAGPMQFATSFEDQTIQDVKAEIAMTDTSHTEKISNTLAVEASLEK